MLTPSTNKKVGEALKLPFANWSSKASESSISSDPRKWTRDDVSKWLAWNMAEFSLDSEVYAEFRRTFRVDGLEMCSMGREKFLALAPDFVGDILFEHLQLLIDDHERRQEQR